MPKGARADRCGPSFMNSIGLQPEPMQRQTDQGGCRLHKGYVLIYLPSSPSAREGYVYEHVAVAEQVLGKQLPEGALVHHHNEVRSDNGNRNLVICQDRAYHNLIHARLRILRAGGDPDRDAFCFNCGLLPMERFQRSARRFNGLHPECAECTAKRWTKRREAGYRKPVKFRTN